MTAHTFHRHVRGIPTQAMAAILDVERWPQWRPGLLMDIRTQFLPSQRTTMDPPRHALVGARSPLPSDGHA